MQLPMNTSVLESIGLTQNEAQVYLTFQKTGSKTAAEIARILRMDKSSCYRAVESLVKRGLLITNPKKRGTTHTAVSPNVLKELYHQKLRDLSHRESQLDEFIQKLIQQSETQRSTYITVQTGLDAIREGMEENLKAAISSSKMIKEIYRLSFPYFNDPYHVKWVNAFAKRRIAAGVSIQQIVDFAQNSVFAPIMKTDVKLLKEIRLMPKEMKGLYGLRISGDITHIISFDEKQDYIDITIKDRFVTELLESLFNFVWIHSRQYK